METLFYKCKNCKTNFKEPCPGSLKKSIISNPLRFVIPHDLMHKLHNCEGGGLGIAELVVIL